MQTRGFQYCCGAVEIGGLNGATKKDIEDAIEAVVAAGEKAGNYAFMSQPPGFMIASTSTENNPAAIKALKANRFRVLARFKNPRSDNWVTLWGRKL